MFVILAPVAKVIAKLDITAHRVAKFHQTSWYPCLGVGKYLATYYFFGCSQINTPLNNIPGYGQLAREESASPLKANTGWLFGLLCIAGVDTNNRALLLLEKLRS
jgi:hypothetical protein